MSYFVFNNKGVSYYSNKKEKLNLKWEQVIEITYGQQSLTDLPETRWSPYFLTIIYKEDNNTLVFTKPFPLKDVDELIESNFHPILNNLKH